MKKVLTSPRVSAKMTKVDVKKALNYSMSLSVIRRHSDRVSSFKMECGGSHLLLLHGKSLFHL